MPETPEPKPESAPLVLIPVTAEDEARRKRRIVLIRWAIALAIVSAAYFIYRHEVDPIHARQSYDAGAALLRAGNYNLAVLAFDRSVGLKPDFAGAYLLRGRAYAGEAKPDLAIADFTRDLALRPNDAQALVARGMAYLDFKDFSSAMADANRAIAADPKLALAYNLRGMATRAMGDARKALEDFDRAVDLSPDADNFFQRASTYQFLGDHRRAIADLNEVIARKPDQAPAYFARSESKRAIGDIEGSDQDRLQGRILDGR
ncbi:MAG: tetratricopeptide repeat protein [Bryobacteraceae bacterium]